MGLKYISTLKPSGGDFGASVAMTTILYNLPQEQLLCQQETTWRASVLRVQ
ncbi:MAG: hypothetical protein N3E45_14665 [Oscillatoriaceae bacterium SKW80]|nr:hypothetical protein [Oscillatoriaceae bacterium SKYG93]MCX8122040.1 hypothetical protein [Oscillatoriaceae bacterium SKW80]MDW8454327.1 hypothetical protein [Oscillatoriaceae cyanobacterium SKYGB_i_bin93]HIK29191.1 hypothetical protein [Oscillatoriaceae cyanobacterium M7585_C2015_266]